MNTQIYPRNQIIGILLTIFMIFAVEAKAVQNGKIAFTSNRDGNDEIYVMNADGSNQMQLTNNPTGDGDVEPAFSPDGTKIAFTSHRNGNDNTEIYVMNADGSNQIRLTNNTGHDYEPTWSPDGAKIAYIRNSSIISIMNADGSGQTTISRGRYLQRGLAWSSDGMKIAFASDDDGVEAINIFVIDVATANITRLTGATFFEYYWSPAWSPDSSMIAYSHDVGFFMSRDELNVMKSDGSSNRPLIDITPNYCVGLSWSPDGAKILFDLRGENQPGDIYAINTDGSGPVNLTNNPANDYDPSWGSISIASVSVSGRVTTPDGRSLRNAVVILTDPLGVRRTATTISFGIFMFDNVAVGENYVIGVSSKRYRFASRNLSVNDILTNVDFVGLE